MRLACLALPFDLVDLDKAPRWSGCLGLGAGVRQTRGVICSVPNCTVSSIATSKEMMRPVILSRPAKVATGLRRCPRGRAARQTGPRRKDTADKRRKKQLCRRHAAHAATRGKPGVMTRQPEKRSRFGRPGWIVAGGLGPGGGGQGRALRPPGVRRARLVGGYRAFPNRAACNPPPSAECPSCGAASHTSRAAWRSRR